MVKEILTRSPEETKDLGRKIGKLLEPRDILLLIGELGAGKTTLIQGLAEGVGVIDYITSPTFVLINEYQGRIPFYHVDLYRLTEKIHIQDLGIEEYFAGSGVTVVEWAERLGKLTPEKYVKIEIQRLSENERKILIEDKSAHPRDFFSH